MKRLTKKYVVPHKGNEHRPHLLRAAGIVALLLFIVGSFALSNIYASLLRASDFFASVLPAVLVDLANEDRGDAALGSLTVSPELQEAARMKAEDMAAKGYFAHYSPDGTSPWQWIREAGYSFVYAGENLAVNFNDSEAVNDAWMRSPLHRANILSGNFTEIGIATARGTYKGRETVFVVQMFGTPAATPVRVASAAAPADADATLVPATPSEVLGEAIPDAAASDFIAVEDTSATPLETEDVTDTRSVPPQSTTLEQLLLSPTTLLALAYTLVLVILGALIIAVSHRNHPYRTKHVALTLFLLVVAVSLFFYQTQVMDTVEIASEIGEIGALKGG